MKFKVDENLPVEAAEELRQAGYDAMTVGEQNLSGDTDSTISTICQHETRALVTLDVDFADIRAYPPDQFPGLIVLRLKRQDKPYVLQVIGRIIQTLPQEPLEQRLWIVEDTRIRIRE